ncbi:hypothetical protein PBI_HUFFY_73 [Gordonia phage Huffy]|uniref:Uncharacterized protein n=1 Tax=Gordonia phage TZGordon TaxID=2744004 RepID=A0A6N0A663_9CAUD|nr:hypothetical protein KDJ61_gp42 [Gordonia phage TZGordon]AQY55674.1 hypothetical protein PBI_HUFFY_73 [Gordonia phage Huffy]AQY55757.1 hypothetical protein PBI_DINODARYN_73 [Gordonia phage DinoDaryn]QKO02992.1 hypothetical protein SEA_TZGORDON_74 [Gordonia phage TZGordon]
MRTYEFEDWAGDKLEVSRASHSSTVLEVGLYGVSTVELPHDAIPNLVAFLLGNLPADQRAEVIEGLQRAERIGPNG